MSASAPDANASSKDAGEQFSVVIPTYQAVGLGRLLDALISWQNAEQRFEILVVGQEDEEEIAGFPTVRYIRVDDRPTPARNRNIGAREAEGKWICFLDSDVVPAPDWFSEMIRAMALEVSVLAGSVRIPVDAGYWAKCDNLLAFENQIVDTAETLHLTTAATINFAVRRSLFLRMNGFDESFMIAAGEDRDLCWRLEKLGYGILYVPRAAVTHHHQRLDRQSAMRHFFRYGEATTHFRLLRSNHLYWRLAAICAHVPLLGEIGGLARVLLRAIMRPLRKPVYLTSYGREMFGLLVLDWAHTRGMLHALRQRKAADESA